MQFMSYQDRVTNFRQCETIILRKKVYLATVVEENTIYFRIYQNSTSAGKGDMFEAHFCIPSH